MSIQKLNVKPSAIYSNAKAWKVGDILVDQSDRQFRISDWDWEDKLVELIELTQDERNHPDYLDGTVNTSKAVVIPWQSPVQGNGEYYVHPDFGNVPYPGGRCQ